MRHYEDAAYCVAKINNVRQRLTMTYNIKTNKVFFFVRNKHNIKILSHINVESSNKTINDFYSHEKMITTL